MKSLGRRDFCRLFSGLPCLAATPFRLEATTREGQEPHFFLQIIFSGGWDVSYLFDARPLALTDAGLMQNYLYRNADSSLPLMADPRPVPWFGNNGGSTLVSPLMNKLERYRPDFSIVNGVLMLSNGLISHGQNMYYLFGGQSANGASFVPLLGQSKGMPLDSLHIGDFGGDGNSAPFNFGSSVALAEGTGLSLAKDLKRGSSLDLQRSSSKFIAQRFAAAAAGDGQWAQGNRQLADAWQRVPRLAQAVKSVEAEAGKTELDVSLALTRQYFKAGVTSCTTLMIDHDPEMDTHGRVAAQNQFDLYGRVVDEIEVIMNWLEKTPFDAERRMLDVTTVMFSSEFSRTMKLENTDVDRTGTDHNPLSNSVLLVGKGIRGGCIVGASDLKAIDAGRAFKSVSPVHRNLDPVLISPMGQAFDFERCAPRSDLPALYKIEDYLGFPSVVNTLLHLAGANPESYFRFGPGSQQKAPILTALLKG